MQNSPFLNRSVAAYHFCGLKRPVPTLCEPALEGGAKDNVHDNTDATIIADVSIKILVDTYVLRHYRGLPDEVPRTFTTE